MVNNFAQIRTLLKFDNGDAFYSIDVMKRRKDNPGLFTDSVLIGSFEIRSIQQFDHLMPIFIEVCNGTNARAYIRLNRRTNAKVSKETLRRISGHNADCCYSSVRSVIDSIIGKHHSEKDRTWVVDLDYDKCPAETDINDWLNELISFVQALIFEGKRDDTVHIVNTVNGVHLVCRPFNRKKFKDKYANIDVHDDNLTLLYAK